MIKYKDSFKKTVIRKSIKISKIIETLGMIISVLLLVVGLCYSALLYDNSSISSAGCFAISLLFVLSAIVNYVWYCWFSLLLSNLALINNKENK